MAEQATRSMAAGKLPSVPLQDTPAVSCLTVTRPPVRRLHHLPIVIQANDDHRLYAFRTFKTQATTHCFKVGVSRLFIS